MRKFLVILVSLVMAFAMAAPAYATEKSYVLDEADVLVKETETECNQMAESYAETTGVDIVVAVISDDSDVTSYADELQKDYSDDSVILVHNMKTREVALETYGKVDKAIDDDKNDELYEIYNEATSFSDAIEKYIKAAKRMIDDSGLFMTEEAAQDENIATQPQKRTIPDHRLKPRLYDGANLLSDQQEKDITEDLDELSEAKKMDVAICFVNSLDADTAAEAADDYYDYNGFGYGKDREGILMFVCMSTRDIYFSTCGPETIGWITDSIAENMVDDVASYLTDGLYEMACDEYIEKVDYYTEDHYNFIALLVAFLIFVALGAGIGMFRVTVNRGKLVSVRYKAEANNYLREGSLDLRKNKATFIRTDVQRVYSPLAKDDDNDSGGHFSSSGSFHGGAGGKF